MFGDFQFRSAGSLCVPRPQLLLALLLTLGTACGKTENGAPSDGAAGGEPCRAGELGCSCYGNGTCDAGLECADQQCIAHPGAGAGDGDGDGDGGDNGTGVGGSETGTDGSGGAPAAGGNPGAGGASSGGASSGGGSGEVAGNLISNGSFENGFDGWVANADSGNLTSDSSKARACFETPDSGQFTLAWPADFGMTFTIKPGVDYQISYRAVSTMTQSVSVQIRQPQDPYTFYFNEFEELKQTWTEHTHDFRLDSGSSNRGLAFIGTMNSPGTVCFDDVVVMELK